MVSSCIVAVTVFWCSLTESNHVLIWAVSPLYFSQSHQTVFYFETVFSSELKWNIKYHTPWSPLMLAHTKISVYLTGFRNAQFRSVTLRKYISWNLAPEEKMILFPPGGQKRKEIRIYYNSPPYVTSKWRAGLVLTINFLAWSLDL